jgi:hypothetical protein
MYRLRTDPRPGPNIAEGWATRPECLADAGSGQLSQALLRGTSFWLTASRTRPDRPVGDL